MLYPSCKLSIAIAFRFRKLIDRDLSDSRSNDFDKRKAVAEQIRHACLTAGFFYGELC
jgi:hypothetical protein